MKHLCKIVWWWPAVAVAEPGPEIIVIPDTGTADPMWLVPDTGATVNGDPWYGAALLFGLVLIWTIGEWKARAK